MPHRFSTPDLSGLINCRCGQQVSVDSTGRVGVHWTSPTTRCGFSTLRLKASAIAARKV